MADRLLLAVMAFGGLLTVYIFAWMAGITPASTGEREFLAMLHSSELAATPVVAAVLADAESSAYTSRAHFLAAAEAFHLASQQAIGARQLR